MGGQGSGRKPGMSRIYDAPKSGSNTQFSEGQKSKGLLDDFAERQNIDTAEGTIQKTPVNAKDIVNKAYVDSFSPTHTESSTDSLTNKTANSFTNDIFADHVHEEIRNESGGAMAIGDAVYVSGFSVGQVKPLVDFADNGSAATMPCVGIIVETLANNATGQIVETGTVTNMDTSAWSVGDDLYVTTTGTTTNTLTSTKPTGTELIQKVAEVLRSHASNGVVEVFGAGRTNDMPNVGEHEFSFGAHTAGFTQQTATGDGTTTIDWKLGNKFYFTFGAQNDTFTFTAPTNPCNLILVLKQDGTGSRIPTFPGTVLWSGGSMPTFSTGAAAVDIVAFYYDGTNYFGVETLDFS